jgi:hypothetical protein
MAKKNKKNSPIEPIDKEENNTPILRSSNSSQTLPAITFSSVSKDLKYIDVATPVALFPFISFSGDKRDIRVWKRTAINPIDGSLIEQSLEFIADSLTKKTAQGKAAWLALLGVKYLWERKGKPEDGKVSFSMHELCRLFNLPYNGRRAKEFYDAFIALNRMTIVSTNALTLIDSSTGKRNPVEKTVNSTFISLFGRIATGNKGNLVERFYVQINDIYVHCLNTQDSSRVNLAMIANLSSSRSISLYVLLCSMYQSYRNEIIDYNLEELAQDLPLNPARNALSKVKEDLEPILKELVRNELLKSYTFLSTNPQTSISKRPKLSEVIVRFELGQRVVIAPAQIPHLIASSSLLLTSSQGEDAIIGRLCKLGYNVNEANIVYKMYTRDHLNYALKMYDENAKKRTINSPLNYFKAIIDKASPEQYTKEANETRKKSLIQNKSKNLNELYKEYYDSSRTSVAESEGIYWEQLVKDEIERLSLEKDFKEKSERDKRAFVEYDLLTSAPYNIMALDAFKDLYLKGTLPEPYQPIKKR